MNELNTSGAGVDLQIRPLQLTLIDGPVVSDLDSFVDKSLQIAHRYPEILDRIETDQIELGIKKKQARIADQEYLNSLTGDLPNFQIPPDSSLSDSPTALELEQGRPRMPALLALVFFFLRGWIGGPNSAMFRLLVPESKTLGLLYDNLAVKPPSANAIADNLNTISEQTAQFCLRCQLDHAKEADLDDFAKQRADSTAIHANSAYPTESTLMSNFFSRVETGMVKLAQLGLHDFTTGKTFKEAQKAIKEIEQCSQIIGMVSGKVGAKETRTNNYRKIYVRVDRACRKLSPLVDQAKSKLEKEDMLPSQRSKILEVIERIKNDIDNVVEIRTYSEQRVIMEKDISGVEKILSTSDRSAAIIKKGGRDIVFGYRPQLAFSGNGLVTAAIIPEGNAADSGQVRNLLEEIEKNTGVIPAVFTVDDGYVNGPVRDWFLKRAEANGIDNPVYSVAGSKGKKALGEETFYSEQYKEARSDRSAAESCISTLKGSFGYGQVMRREIEAVRQEQMSKVLAYNVWKLITLERRKEKEIARQAEEKLSQVPPERHAA